MVLFGLIQITLVQGRMYFPTGVTGCQSVKREVIPYKNRKLHMGITNNGFLRLTIQSTLEIKHRNGNRN